MVVHNAPDQFADPLRPAGVKDVIQLNRNIFSIRYDAKVISARDTLNTGSSSPISLAPLRPHDEVTADIRKTAYTTVLSSILTIPILVLSWAPLPTHKMIYGSVSLALATVIQVVVAGPFYPRAFRSLIWTRTIDMDLLIVLSTSTTYLFSVTSFIYQVKGTSLPTGLFFETSALLISLIMIGRLISDFACQRAVKSRSIRSLQPPTALLIDTSNRDVDGGTELDARLLQYGDVFRVKPGCPVVTDGIIISGNSEFDESMLTGEARLVERKAGSLITAGSVNHSGTVSVQLTRLPGGNTIDEVTHSKPKIQETADQFAGYVVPAIGALAMMTVVIWFAVGKLVRSDSTRLAISKAIPYAISVLVVSCPCAVGLAVPMVLVIANGVAAGHGVIFKSAEAMRVAQNITHVVFDKTGTLTEDRLSVLVEDYLTESRMLTGALALALTSQVQILCRRLWQSTWKQQALSVPPSLMSHPSSAQMSKACGMERSCALATPGG